MASTLSADKRERMSVTVRPTDEKSLSDCAKLAEMQRIRLAVKDRIGNSLALSFQKASGVSAAAGTFSALYCANSSFWRRCELLRPPTQMKKTRNHAGRQMGPVAVFFVARLAGASL